MSAGARGAGRRVWILNLDAERELERFAVDSGAGRPAGRPARYSTPAALRAIGRRQGPRAARRLLGPDDLARIDGTLVDRDGRPVDPRLASGAEGRAWSPTPTALAALAELGASVPHSPAAESLARANARPLAAGVANALAADGPTCPKAVVDDLASALAAVARPARLGWLVRRPFGAAGRGRRRLHAGRPSPEERAWLEASLRLGPLVVEPFVEVVAETTRCAWLAPDGALAIAPPGLQSTDAHGAWLATADAAPDDIARRDDARLLAAVEAAARALHAVGYFGPFGIDAFWHRPPDGRPGATLHPLSEINARHTMDWTPPGRPES